MRRPAPRPARPGAGRRARPPSPASTSSRTPCHRAPSSSLVRARVGPPHQGNSVPARRAGQIGEAALARRYRGGERWPCPHSRRPRAELTGQPWDREPHQPAGLLRVRPSPPAVGGLSIRCADELCAAGIFISVTALFRYRPEPRRPRWLFHRFRAIRAQGTVILHSQPPPGGGESLTVFLAAAAATLDDCFDHIRSLAVRKRTIVRRAGRGLPDGRFPSQNPSNNFAETRRL